MHRGVGIGDTRLQASIGNGDDSEPAIGPRGQTRHCERGAGGAGVHRDGGEAGQCCGSRSADLVNAVAKQGLTLQLGRCRPGEQRRCEAWGDGEVPRR